MKMGKLFRTIVSKCLVIGFISIGLISCAGQSQPADFVFTNGKIYTVDKNQEWAEAVVVKGDNIVYAGSNEGAKDFIGEETNVTDLIGKIMLPGIISAHEHPITFMGLSSGLIIEYSGDSELMLNSLKDYIETNPEGPYHSFGGAYEGTVEIYRQDIDKIISDKPFVMISQSGHGGWANTKA
jgi:predicted amidohydrolase YtcJ